MIVNVMFQETISNLAPSAMMTVSRFMTEPEENTWCYEVKYDCNVIIKIKINFVSMGTFVVPQITAQ